VSGLIYFSSVTDNTHRFVQKLGLEAFRLPVRTAEDTVIADRPYVLVVPTYGGGNGLVERNEDFHLGRLRIGRNPAHLGRFLSSSPRAAGQAARRSGAAATAPVLSGSRCLDRMLNL
jgi:protein involved in ribonucleotide reduction